MTPIPTRLARSLQLAAVASIAACLAGTTLTLAASQLIRNASRSTLTGAIIAAPGWSLPQGNTQAFDRTRDLAFQGNGASPAVAKDVIPGYSPIHLAQNVNDGKYGNGTSWISNTSNSWIKINLGRPVMIDGAKFGRDRTGYFNDRDPGRFTISVATADSVYANGHDANDAVEYQQIFDSQAFAYNGTVNGAETIEVQFAPVLAQFVKFQATAIGVAIDELEIFGTVAAAAGPDFSVNEGQSVTLDGTGSSDPSGAAITYAWAQLPGGTPVTLSDPASPQPNFTAPPVAIGGETLSFELTVSANGKSSTDGVSVTVVNVNHPPVADAGLNQSIAEGALVTLHGEASFDIDTDAFGYAWVQTGGSPTVALSDPAAAQPTFTAPVLGANGAAGVVASLVFELRVDDGFPLDAPASGYTFENVVDRVTIDITNVNNLPAAAAGVDQTVDENSVVALTGAGSVDPDNDSLSYAWTEAGGSTVSLGGSTTATPSFTAPFVGTGGADLEFILTVDDGYGGSASESVVVHVQNINDPPLASAAQPTVAVLWPPNHGLVTVGITGVSDPNSNATIIITGVTQDEPTNGLGDGDTPVDAIINSNGTVLLRAERSGKGDGRVYRIAFTASDLEGSSSGEVVVTVPHSAKKPAVDSGLRVNSTTP